MTPVKKYDDHGDPATIAVQERRPKVTYSLRLKNIIIVGQGTYTNAVAKLPKCPCVQLFEVLSSGRFAVRALPATRTKKSRFAGSKGPMREFSGR